MDIDENTPLEFTKKGISAAYDAIEKIWRGMEIDEYEAMLLALLMIQEPNLSDMLYDEGEDEFAEWVFKAYKHVEDNAREYFQGWDDTE